MTMVKPKVNVCYLAAVATGFDAERPRVTGTRAIAEAMGQNNWYHAQDFDAVRAIELSLLV